jgi:hypothetical protein
MSATPYLAILKASYDYVTQSDDEVALKEDQLLFLLDKSDPESVHRPPTSRSSPPAAGGR